MYTNPVLVVLIKTMHFVVHFRILKTYGAFLTAAIVAYVSVAKFVFECLLLNFLRKPGLMLTRHCVNHKNGDNEVCENHFK